MERKLRIFLARTSENAPSSTRLGENEAIIAALLYGLEAGARIVVSRDSL
jgi:hypothetical protein